MNKIRRSYNKGKNHPMFGKHHSEETKRKISKSKKGKNHPMFGKHHSEKTRRKISEKNKGNKKAWKGGKIINNGYIHLFKPEHPLANSNGYIAEHRLMAEKILGRHLKTNEIVHHINENRSDNRNCNFLICTKTYNTWLHHKMKRLKIFKNEDKWIILLKKIFN